MTEEKMEDQAALFLCCLIFYLCTPEFGARVLPVVLAVAFTAFSIYFSRAEIQAAFAAGYIAWCLFLPGMTAFLPAVCYAVLATKYRYLCLTGLIPLISFCCHSSTAAIAGTVLLPILGLLLEHRSLEVETLKQKSNHLRDSGKELSTTLERQNRKLLEQQDTGIRLATLDERNRIARDIHDSVGHLLSSSILQVGALLAVYRDEKLRENLLALKDTLSSAMDAIRSSVHGLYGESIDLYAQVNQLVRNFTFCKLDLCYELESEPPTKLKYAFIAITKEALTNIVRHSDATAAKITFHEHPALYQLIISDNGHVKNFDPDGGIGLKNIAQRVESFHGNLNLLTRNGFTVFISIPKGDIKK